MTIPLRWRIVPEEATEEQSGAGYFAVTKFAPLESRGFDAAEQTYTAMLAHAPAPTAEDIDAMCRAMWPQSGCYEDKLAMRPDGEIAEWAKRDRTEYRQQMSAFLHRLGAKP